MDMLKNAVLTRKAEVVSVTGGGFTVTASCVAAATMRAIASRTFGLLRMPSGVNSENWIGSCNEGKGFPVFSHTSTIWSTEEEIMSRKAFSSLVILASKGNVPAVLLHDLLILAFTLDAVAEVHKIQQHVRTLIHIEAMKNDHYDGCTRPLDSEKKKLSVCPCRLSIFIHPIYDASIEGSVRRSLGRLATSFVRRGCSSRSKLATGS